VAKESYVEERDVEFFGGVATRQIAPDVHIVIADYSRHQIRCGNAFRPLSRVEHTLLFDECVDIVRSGGRVGDVVVGDKINLYVR
jgi:hypothetical protein